MHIVSVIIPVYNVERFLPACLDSVLHQTLPDLEVICIDDASPDRCGEILDAYAAEDSRVKVIHLPENHRQGYARNRGLEQASGRYVYFLDSDDMIEPEALAELTGLADRDALDAVFFDARNVFESEELKKIYVPPASPRKGNYRDDVYTGIDLMDAFTRQNEWTCYPQRIFWRRDFLLKEGIRYPEGCEHEDEFFAFAGILAAERVRYVRKQYFILRVRPDSVMTSPAAPKNFHGYLMNYYYMNRFLDARGIYTYGAEVCSARMYERAMMLYRNLKDRFNLQEMFAGEPDRTVWQFFSWYLRTETGENGYNAMDPEVLDRIRQYRIAYIFGTGPTAQRVCRKLEHNGILVGSFLTDSHSSQPPVLMGRCVQNIEEADLPADAIVVAGVKMMYWDSVRAMLEEKKISCVFHRKI